MKTTMLKAFAVLVFASCLTSAEAKVITLLVNTNPARGAIIGTNEVTIGENESATVLSMSSAGSGSAFWGKDGITNNISVGNPLNEYPLAFAGPAVAKIMGAEWAFITMRIEPEAFPPDKTLIIPASTKGATVILESSPDLIHWTNSVPGFYTNLVGNLFFRLRPERLAQ